jgi:hypothetical protein
MPSGGVIKAMSPENIISLKIRLKSIRPALCVKKFTIAFDLSYDA